MGIDRPDDAEVPRDKLSDHPADRSRAETRYRQEYDTDLRATAPMQKRTEPVGRSEPGARSKPGGQTENGQPAQHGSSWAETTELSRWMWTEYKRRWPPEERPPADRSNDSPGTWHGDGGRALKSADNEQVEAACDRIVDREEKTISPAMRAIESQDPHRHLVVSLKDRGLRRVRSSFRRESLGAGGSRRSPGRSGPGRPGPVPTSPPRHTGHAGRIGYGSRPSGHIPGVTRRGGSEQARPSGACGAQTHKGICQLWKHPACPSADHRSHGSPVIALTRSREVSVHQGAEEPCPSPSVMVTAR